jgi:hypothetical protein
VLSQIKGDMHFTYRLPSTQPFATYVQALPINHYSECCGFAAGHRIDLLPSAHLIQLIRLTAL